MKISFVIHRINWLRALGPIIEACLRDPTWDVEIVLGPKVKGTDPKSYLNPDRASLPSRLTRGGTIREVETAEEAAKCLQSSAVAITIIGRERLLGPWSKLAHSPLWCVVFDVLHSAEPSSAFGDADLAFWPTSHYFEIAVKNGVAGRDHLHRISRIVGNVKTDIPLLLSRAETRARWGVRENARVVLYIPDSFRLNPELTYVNPWYRDIWCVDNRGERVARTLLRHRKETSLRFAFKIGEYHLLQRLRAFCESNDALLFVAPRKPKDTLHGHPNSPGERRFAHHLLHEDSFYPPTLIEALNASDLAICAYRSRTVLEAAIIGTPYISIALPKPAYPADHTRIAADYDAREGHWPGVCWVIPVEEFFDKVGGYRFEDFHIDETTRAAYLEELIGPVDGRASERVLAEIRVALDERRKMQMSGAESKDGAMIRSQPLP